MSRAERALVIAHRGASARALENSLAAFRAAAGLGADAVELDVHATADGVIVVHHDEAIAGHRIARMTRRQLTELRLANGEPVPTLADVLALLGRALQVFVEVKSLPPQFDETLLGVLRNGPNPPGYAVHAFDHRVVLRLGTVWPGLRRGVLSSSYPIRPLALLRDAGATILWQEHTLVDRSLVDALHDAGMRLIVWTVDDAAEMRQLVEIGVDGICTNRPEVGRRTVDTRAA